ncbi:hypothetical protein BGW42_006075 [Actinomortierella wolfii]|nr:hypothetical protein BGW42_006075 [Actinomortierella wolfii]
MTVHSVSTSTSTSTSSSPSPTQASSPTPSSPSTSSTSPASLSSPSMSLAGNGHSKGVIGSSLAGKSSSSNINGISNISGVTSATSANPAATANSNNSSSNSSNSSSNSSSGSSTASSNSIKISALASSLGNLNFNSNSLYSSNGIGAPTPGQSTLSTIQSPSAVSNPFAMNDYFSSSLPKSSIHINSLSSGSMSNLSLAAAAAAAASAPTNTQYSGNNNTQQQQQPTNEEITTIFVVGFPDDMQEREFQNMFVFTPGFEAATLKIPNKDQQDDDAMTLGVNGVNPRKQIIGFAKFRTHQEALAARDVLNGRKVDPEKGCVLKAELAKKNLHSRRVLSSDGSHSTTNPYPINPVNINKPVHPLHQHRNSLANIAAYDAFHSVPCSPALPSDLLSPHDYPSSYDFYADVYAPNGSGLSFEPFGGRFQQQQQQQQQQSQQSQQHHPSDLSSSFVGRQSGFDRGVDPLSLGPLSTPNAGGLAGSISGSFSNSISTSYSNRHPGGFGTSHRYSSKGFLEMDNDTPSTLSYLSKSIPAHTERGFNSALFGNEDITGRFHGLSISTTAAAALASPSLPSPGLPSPGFRPPVNPGDQNPPCNTLYVGNLPMNASEDELRALFSRCVGYRRLCFRTKNNGPMCFVEFENIECATQALNDLYGNPLSNSVKGGIRLSFSKNPLGVRNSVNNNNNASNNGINQSGINNGGINQSKMSNLGHQLHTMNTMNGMGGGPLLDRRDSMTIMF